MQSIKVQRRRRVKVFDETFFKKFRPETGAAGGKKQGNARTRPQGDRARPGLCATPRGGHTSPLFWSMGRRWLVSAAASVGPERCPPGTRTPRTPVRSWGFTPNPTTFEKVDETFTRLRRGRALAVSTGAAVAAAPKRVLRAQALRRLSLPQQAQGLHQLFLLHAAQLRGFHSLLQVLLHLAQLLFL